MTGVSTYADRKEYGTNDEGLMWMERNVHLGTIQRHEMDKGVAA